MNIAAIILICIVVTALSKVIEPTSREIKFLLSVGAAVIILISLTDDINDVVKYIDNISQKVGVSNNIISVSVKILGISYICELCSSSCRDAGESALGCIIDISGKISVALICLPIVSSLIETVVQILE